jgi:hypothetical protein
VASNNAFVHSSNHQLSANSHSVQSGLLNCCRLLPAQSFWVLTPVRLMIIFEAFKTFKSRCHFMADSQSVCLGVEPTLWMFGQVLLPFQVFGSEICCLVLSLWGALSHERPGLSFVSHSVVICLCVHLLFTFLSFTPSPPPHTHTHFSLSIYIYTYLYIYIHIYIYTHTYNIYKASFSLGSVEQIMAYYSLVADATRAV